MDDMWNPGDRDTAARTSRLCDHINEELQAMGDGAALAVPYLFGWMVSQLAKANAQFPAEAQAGLDYVLDFVRKAWLDAERRATEERGPLN